MDQEMNNIMDLHPYKKALLINDEDLSEYLLEMGWDDVVLDEGTFTEFWELVLDWQKEVQK